MSYSGVYAFSMLAAVTLLALPARGQTVISTHSGVIHFFEGAVYLGGQPLESRLGRFLTVPQGGELRTGEGHAEVLLTPGVLLRMDERSAIRMVANDLADTQVELQTGSVIVDSGEPNSGTSVTLIYKDWRIHFSRKGIYRIDSDPPRLQVHEGEAEVFAAAVRQPVSVTAGMFLPFAPVLVPERTGGQSGDALSEWAKGRSESIAADNAITAQIDEDPASGAPGTDSFTYFPLVGLPPFGAGLSGAFSSFGPYQPGFSSIYLPGYTYQPLMLGLLGRGLRIYSPSFPRRTGFSSGAGAVGPFSGPIGPVSRPVGPVSHPTTAFPIPHAGAHVGGHR